MRIKVVVSKYLPDKDVLLQELEVVARSLIKELGIPWDDAPFEVAERERLIRHTPTGSEPTGYIKIVCDKPDNFPRAKEVLSHYLEVECSLCDDFEPKKG